MSNALTTAEFGICLQPNLEIVQAVETLRRDMPASPHRDDTPHLTLQRTIRSPEMVDDDTLCRQVETALDPLRTLPVTATAGKVTTRFSPLYGPSSVLLVRPSPELRDLRSDVTRRLRAAGYTVGLLERLISMPHISVRLGVPSSCIDRPPHLCGQPIAFDNWAVFRVLSQGKRRSVRELWAPNDGQTTT